VLLQSPPAYTPSFVSHHFAGRDGSTGAQGGKGAGFARTAAAAVDLYRVRLALLVSVSARIV